MFKNGKAITRGLCSAMFVLVGLLVMTPASFANDQITVEYTFDYPSITDFRSDGQIYDRVVIKDAPEGGLAGQPALPSRGARILVPYGMKVAGIEVIPDGVTELGDGYRVRPANKQFRLSADPSEITATAPDFAIYGSNNQYPSAAFENIGVQSFRGYQILTLRLYPVHYFPQSGRLVYSERLQVVVTTEPDDTDNGMYRGFVEDEKELAGRVDNVNDMSSYYAAPITGSRAFDYLIITTPELAASFEPLRTYHNNNGLVTEIHTTDVIGGTDPDLIRDYIRDRYTNDGIQYVLIGADDDIIPAKDLYVRTDPGSSAYVEYEMPGDIYFSCLDGTYNYDGDSYWGEPTDGESGGDVDLVAEVFVGRACAGNTTEADRFVSKTLHYKSTSGTYLQKVVLPGEHLGFGGVSEYAAATLDELVDSCSTNGQVTVGIPSSTFEFDRLYDRDWPGNDWAMSEFVNRVNDNVHIVNHLGHGSPDYAIKMYNSDVLSQFTNSEFCLVYSQTCLAGHLDGTDCWAETINIKTDAGAFAVLMNARYGFGEYNSTDGASQRFNREFWDAIFSVTEGKPELGRANSDSKEDNLYRISDDCMRWCYYEINLFGDPAISLNGVEGISFAFPYGVPHIVEPGHATSFEVVVSPAGDGVPVSGSGQLHYRINGGAWTSEYMVELESNHYQGELPGVGCDDLLEYYVSAEEATHGTFNSPDPASPNDVVVASEYGFAFYDGFETDLGWDLSEGNWGRGTPTGGGGEYGSPDPTAAYDGYNVLGYNLDGDYENSMTEMSTTSPAFDCSGRSGASLGFWRWLGVEQPSYDHAAIKVSNDGTSWTTVWENTGTIADATWTSMNVDISAIADDQPTVYLRFVMGGTDSGWRYCGWNIDELVVTAYECTDFMCGDCNNDKSGPDISDLTYMVKYLFQEGPAPVNESAANVNGEGGCDISDLTYLVNFLFLSGDDLTCK